MYSFFKLQTISLSIILNHCAWVGGGGGDKIESPTLKFNCCIMPCIYLTIQLLDQRATGKIVKFDYVKNSFS